MPETRRYRVKPVIYPLGAFFVGASVYVGILVSNPVVLVGFAAQAALAAWAFFRVIPHRTAIENADGFTAAPFAPWKPWITTPWADIEDFRRGGNYVFLCRTDGTRFLLGGFNCTGTNYWNGGKTRDLIGELNARVELWQHASAVQAD